MSVFKQYRFYSKEEIERSVNDILRLMQNTPKYAPKWPLDASRVAEFLELDVVWDSIPSDEQGPIAARILPLDHLIEINDDIPELRGGFGESTIAHEIGHWVLHINPEEVDKFLKHLEQGINTTQETFLCRSVSSQKGIEWQAQYFASCLLMPRQILEEKRVGRDLKNWHHLYAMAEDLGVTISNLKNRLQNLGWIYIPEGSRRIYLGSAAPSRNK